MDHLFSCMHFIHEHSTCMQKGWSIIQAFTFTLIKMLNLNFDQIQRLQKYFHMISRNSKQTTSIMLPNNNTSSVLNYKFRMFKKHFEQDFF